MAQCAHLTGKKFTLDNASVFNLPVSNQSDSIVFEANDSVSQDEASVFNLTVSNRPDRTLLEANDSVSQDYETTSMISHTTHAFFEVYISLGILVLGAVCNTISVMVICKMKPFKSTSMCMMALAAMDTMALVFSFIWLKIPHTGSLFCYLIYPAFFFTRELANWILVFITIERFTAVWFPFQVNEVFRMRSTAVILGLQTTVLIVVNIPYDLSCEETNVTKNLLQTCLVSFGPCGMLLIFNTLILIKFRQITRTRCQLTLTSKSVGQTKMVIALTVGFLVLVLPFCVFRTVSHFYHTISVFRLVIAHVFHFMLDLTHVINFFLYVLSGRKFRSILLNWCCKYSTNSTRGDDSCGSK